MERLKIELDHRFLSGTENDLAKLCEKILESEEFEASKSAIENNVCHNNESVYDHTLHVFNRFLELLRLNFVGNGVVEKARGYFSKKIGKFTRAELFLISALLHDLGKNETLVVDGEGVTKAPGHELKSAEIAQRTLKDLGLGNDENAYVVNLVKLHSGYALRFLDFLNNLGSDQLKSALSSVILLPEVFLYMIADNESADVFESYKKMIQEKFLQEKTIYAPKPMQQDLGRVGGLIEKVLSNLRINSKPWSTETRLFHLSEEVGELHDIYLQCVGAKDRVQTIDDIKNALNDVLLETLALYDIFGISIKDSLEKILKENEK